MVTQPVGFRPLRALATALRTPSLALALALSAPLACADTATTREVARSIDIAAPADAVWAIVGDFADMSYLDAMVSETEIVRGENNAVGAQRAITLHDGGRILETLTDRQAQPPTLSYRMDEGPLPVADYQATLEVTPSGDASRVTWSGRFRPLADAATGDDDGTAAEALIGGIYEAGLAAIKTAAEHR